MKRLKTLLAGSIGILVSAHTAFASSVFTIEDIPKIKSVKQVAISPNGKHIAFTRSVPRELYVEKDGKHYSQLFVTTNKGDERPYLTGKVNISNVQWAKDGSALYFLAKLNNAKHTTLYRIPVDGGQALPVLAIENTSITDYQLGPQGKRVALLAMPAKDKNEKKLKKLGFKAEVYELGLKNKALSVVDLPSTYTEVTWAPEQFKEYVSDVEFSNKGNTLLVKTQPTALIDDKYMKSQWHLFDLSTKQITTSFATEGKLDEAEFSHDDKYIAILAAQDKHDPATGRLYLADSKTGNIDLWLPNFMGQVRDIEWASTKNRLYFTGFKGTRSFVAELKPGSSKYKTLIKENKKLIIDGLTVSNSDKTLTFNANSFAHPGEVYTLRGKKTNRVTHSNPWLKNKRLAKQETITFKAEDGVVLDGVLIYPLDYKKGTKYPLIMSVHGGPESHDKDGWITNYSRPGQMAAARGYAVFYPNYRGSTGKGVAYSKLGQGDYAGEEFNDLVRFKNHLVEMGLIDPKRVGITGGSYGGYASAWAATKLTEHFAASVMFVGVTNQLSKFGTTDIANEMFLVHARSHPWQKWDFYLERSPIYWAGQSKTPLLIMHGKDDPRVHPAQSMEMYRYMKVQDKDVRLVYYPGEGHGNKKVAAQYDYSLRLMRWMDNYLIHGNKTMPEFEIDHGAKLAAKKQ